MNNEPTHLPPPLCTDLERLIDERPYDFDEQDYHMDTCPKCHAFEAWLDSFPPPTPEESARAHKLACDWLGKRHLKLVTP